MGIALAALFGLAGSAQATLFSFASGVNHTTPTFMGTVGGGGGGGPGSFTFSEFSRPNTFTLVVDDNNGPLAALLIPVEFRASFSASNGFSTPVVGTLFQHSYRTTGTFGFYNAAGAPLLTASFGTQNPGLLTIPGRQNFWSSTGAVLGADSFTDVTYTASTAFVTALGGAATAAQYGIVVGPGGTASSSGPDDFAFDLSFINAGGPGVDVAIDPTTRAPTVAFQAESSFSGAASGGIPSPGPSALALAATLVLSRRRR